MTPHGRFRLALDRLLPESCNGLGVLLSGGPDSTLLALLAAHDAARRGLDFLCLHVNHGLRGAESDAEETWVRSLCTARGWPLRCQRLHPATRRGNLQDWARRARRVFAEESLPGEWALLTGHHAQDQRESVLMALCQGKLPWGLAGMPARQGRWLKPLLAWERFQVLEDLESLDQDWCTDSSNLRSHGLRNRVRLELMPTLRRSAGSELDSLLDAIARDMGTLLAAIDREAQKLLETQDLRPERWGHSLVRQGWDRYHGAVVRKALEALGRHSGAWGRGPSNARLDSIRTLLLTGHAGNWLPLGKGHEISLSRDRVHLHPRFDPLPSRSLEPGARIDGPDWSMGRTAPGNCPEGAAIHHLPPDLQGRTLQVRAARAGDRLRLSADARKSVGSLLAEAGWSRPERALRPLLANEQDILWIPGLRRAWQPGPDSPQQARELVWVLQ
ncbi:MAG: tRNA lysidine(34) synthetase TilS [Calditrichaeota bacterium]|nr:tRNA lysidine(34) synthetase TilS [Calditrichota bacterium]